MRPRSWAPIASSLRMVETDRHASRSAPSPFHYLDFHKRKHRVSGRSRWYLILTSFGGHSGHPFSRIYRGQWSVEDDVDVETMQHTATATRSQNRPISACTASSIVRASCSPQAFALQYAERYASKVSSIDRAKPHWRDALLVMCSIPCPAATSRSRRRSMSSSVLAAVGLAAGSCRRTSGWNGLLQRDLSTAVCHGST